MDDRNNRETHSAQQAAAAAYRSTPRPAAAAAGAVFVPVAERCHHLGSNSRQA
ncbi:MAG: hypothetical protein ACKO3T_15975 [Planctomycetaceae bacterium]